MASSYIESDPVFDSGIQALRDIESRSEIVVSEIPAPQNLAPLSIAFSLEVMPKSHSEDSEFGSGRLVILYDPNFNDSWNGHCRIILYAHAPLDPEIGIDPYLSAVAWSWLMDSLTEHDAAFHSEAGTATKIISTGFGSLADQGNGAKIELRASWTPQDFSQIVSHMQAIFDVVSLVSGLPPNSSTDSLLLHKRSRNVNNSSE